MPSIEKPSLDSFLIGYCTNVHAGRDLPAVLDNLEKYCLSVRKIASPSSDLGIGLWFSDLSAQQALEGSNISHLKETLEKFRLVPFTLNGFPQGDFHSQVVKHRVYQPEWWQRERCDYTLNLIKILDGILPDDQKGSISTLPIAWGTPTPTREQLLQASRNLLEIAESLHQLYESSGRFITLAIEPEPGCFLTDSKSLRLFFNEFLSSPLLSSREAQIARNHLGVCHDVCHAAVMFEDQAHELACMKNDGIGIGKVQVSSAIEINWESLTPTDRVKAFEELGRFAEDRYLHQTNSKSDLTNASVFFEDLPLALNSVHSPGNLGGVWRVHFHVPIYLEQFGLIGSTQPEIGSLLQILVKPGPDTPNFTGHFELETYAWGVAPEKMKVQDLAQGIATEVRWFTTRLKETLS